MSYCSFPCTLYESINKIEINVIILPLLLCLISVPSQAPSGFTVTASTSTSITASWQLPPKYARHGIITGFKLFYAKKASGGSPTVFTNNITSLSRDISGLDEYTEYEFQVLAFSSKGDGPKSDLKSTFTTTKEDSKKSKITIANVMYIRNNSYTNCGCR